MLSCPLAWKNPCSTGAGSGLDNSKKMVKEITSKEKYKCTKGNVLKYFCRLDAKKKKDLKQLKHSVYMDKRTK